MQKGGPSVGGVPMFVWLSYEEVYDKKPTLERLRDLLKGLPLSEVLILCARVNLYLFCVGEGGMPFGMDLERQRVCANALFPRHLLERLDKTQRQSSSLRPIFLRPQMLELMRWATLLCEDDNYQPDIVADREFREKFAESALIANDLITPRQDRLMEAEPSRKRQDQIRASLPWLKKTADMAYFPHIDHYTGRGMMLHYGIYPKVDKLQNFPREFEKATGLSLDEYFFWISLMLAAQTNLVEKQDLGMGDRSGLFPRDWLSHDLPTQCKESYERFCRVVAQPPEELKKGLWPQGYKRSQLSTPSDDFISKPFLTRVFRKKPVLLASEGRAIVLDAGFLLEKMAYGPIWELPRSSRRDLLREFGTALEEYLHSVFAPRFGRSSFLASLFGHDLRPREEPSAQVADFYYARPDERSVVLFEAKSVWLKEDSVEANDPGRFQKQVKERYVTSASGDRKGVSQIADNLRKVLRAEWTTSEIDFSQVREVYPVLVCRDPAIGWIGFPEYLNHRMKEFMGWATATDHGWEYGNVRIAPLIVLTIDDIEFLAEPKNPHTARGTKDLLSVLHDYDSGYPQRNASFLAFRHNSPLYRSAFSSNSLLLEKKSHLFAVLQRLCEKWGLPVPHFPLESSV